MGIVVPSPGTSARVHADMILWRPRKVLLFSGHMIDASDRMQPRFPADKEPLAADAIRVTLDRLDVGPKDLAICGGACGGDILFTEGALERGARLELYIPFDESTFLSKSVDVADGDWHARFFAVKSRAILDIMPVERGSTPESEDKKCE